ncbi:MAG: LicD family protein [Clostridiales bacterium]|nr:LicD family protein [Clostridiales bacterium]
MLTDIQQKLLQMMKELDKVCRKHDIHYTLGGGTAIGAIRHRGFIPWDDDIDLYMTRDNWEKFKMVAKFEDLPPNRVIESAETDLKYTNSIARYVTTDSTAVHSHQIISDDPAGHVIDVFVFDPIHRKNYRKFFADINLYADLLDETKSYSSRFDLNRARYFNALRKWHGDGKEAVIRDLVKDFKSMADPGWKHYIMEWGIAPFLFPASIFDGGYIRVPFEDTTVEIVRNYNEYLVWQYGDEWQYIPDHEGREGHDAIFSSTLPYTVVREDYMPFIDANKVRSAYLRRKSRLLMANPYRRKAERAQLEEKAAAFAEKFVKKITYKALSEGADMEAMAASGKYYKLAELFKDYFDLQFSNEFAGRRDKHSTLRRYSYPVLIPLDQRTIELAAETLLHIESMSKAKRLIDIYTGRFPENFDKTRRKSARLDDLRMEILITRQLIDDYSVLNIERAEASADGKDPAEATAEHAAHLYEEVCSFLEAHSRNTYILRLKLKLLLDRKRMSGAEEESADIAEEFMQTLGKLGELCPEGSLPYAEVIKFTADLSDADADTYAGIYSLTSNGCLKLEIEDILAARGKMGMVRYLRKAAEEAEQAAEAAAAEKEETADTEAVAYEEKKDLYSTAKDLYKKAAGRDDRIKEEAWNIALRTGDRVKLLEHYADMLEELTAMKENEEWDALREKMAPHEKAVLRNLDLGLGLCVHPLLSEIQYELFRRDGRDALVGMIEDLIPERHRTPIGERPAQEPEAAHEGTQEAENAAGDGAEAAAAGEKQAAEPAAQDEPFSEELEEAYRQIEVERSHNGRRTVVRDIPKPRKRVVEEGAVPGAGRIGEKDLLEEKKPAEPEIEAVPETEQEPEPEFDPAEPSEGSDGAAEEVVEAETDGREAPAED